MFSLNIHVTIRYVKKLYNLSRMIDFKYLSRDAGRGNSFGTTTLLKIGQLSNYSENIFIIIIFISLLLKITRLL